MEEKKEDRKDKMDIEQEKKEENKQPEQIIYSIKNHQKLEYFWY